MNTMRCSIDKNHEFCTTYEANKEDVARAFGTMSDANRMVAYYKQHKAQLEPYFTTIAR